MRPSADMVLIREALRMGAFSSKIVVLTHGGLQRRVPGLALER